MNILEEIASHARERVAADKLRVPLDDLKAATSASDGSKFVAALKRPELSFICEIKKASPSKGIIAAEFPYVEIAKAYEAAGADCVSCLTEPKYFLGSDKIFRAVREEISLPMLRKDFTVDEYQLYQAKVMGADAVLLICAILDTATLERFLGVCDELNLAALVEAHDAQEIKSAVAAGAEIIGVNNRNLKNFSVDFTNAARLRELIPPEKIYVAESGVKTPADVATLKKIGADAVLIGETLMRAADKRAELQRLRAAT
ncbi:MAG: indole-3-glycerol phosphate synthase TrpC [Selenomonadaceae bacterium]|nr:indole-3-glycerol phosphate synthase TrpC [Selenomonadaceae bacterium]